VLPTFLDAAKLDINLQDFPASGGRKNSSPDKRSPADVLGADCLTALLAQHAEGNAAVFATYFPEAKNWPGLDVDA